MTASRKRRLLSCSGSLTFALTTACAWADATRSLSIDQCVSLALEHNPDVLGRNGELAQAQAVAAGAEGRLGPRLHIDANVQQWNSPFAIQFGGENFTVRDAFTWVASASIIQPLSELWAIYENYRLQDKGVDVASVRRDATRRDVAFEVTEAYLRTLEAERLSEVAAASLEQLSAQLREARSLYANGVVSQTDVLRAEVAVANAKQRTIQQRGLESLTHARLATAVGLPAGESIEPRPLTREPPPRSTFTIEEVERRAVAGRVESRELDAEIDQARTTVSGARARLLPSIDVVGNYAHNVGSQFVQENALYIGATASWDVWDWGATSSGIGEAQGRVQQLLAARAKVDQTVRLDARQAYVDVQTAADGMDAAKTAVTSAEENFRLVTKRYEAAAATAFDVIDAEALVTQARGQMQTSLYDYLIACAALDRSAGIAPNLSR
jgi:outer membrane protein